MNVDEADPSEPSQIDESPRLRHAGTVHRSRAEAVRHGMWRGAKIGFVAFCVVLPAMCLGILLFCVAFVPSTRQAAMFELERALHEAQQANVFSAIGWTVVFFSGFGVLYGAIPGAVIGALVAAIRWRRPGQNRDFRV
jgi:hypothetical protein